MARPEITPDLVARTLPGTFPGDLGIELVSIADDEVHGRLAVDRRHLHPGGYVHGGVWVAFADTVAAWGTFRHLRRGRTSPPRSSRPTCSPPAATATR